MLSCRTNQGGRPLEDMHGDTHGRYKTGSPRRGGYACVDCFCIEEYLCAVREMFTSQ